MLVRVSGIALAATVTVPALALEKAPARAPDASAFQASATVEIAYFNVCTGWVWNWSGVPPEAHYGVFYRDLTAEPDRLLRTHIFYAQGAPPGYGYTSIARVLPPFDPRCPDFPSLDIEPFLPQQGWNTIVWNGDAGIPVESFFVLVSHSPEPGNPTVIVTEKGEGTVRPGGCGICYGPERPPFSFQFGQGPAIVCPGLPWFDGSECSLELVWRTEMRIGFPTGVESASWGKVKSLYR